MSTVNDYVEVGLCGICAQEVEVVAALSCFYVEVSAVSDVLAGCEVVGAHRAGYIVNCVILTAVYETELVCGSNLGLKGIFHLRNGLCLLLIGSLVLSNFLSDEVSGELGNTGIGCGNVRSLGNAEGLEVAVSTKNVLYRLFTLKKIYKPSVCICLVGPYVISSINVVDTLAVLCVCLIVNEVSVNVLLSTVDHGVELVAAVNLLSEEVGSFLSVVSGLEVLVLIHSVSCVEVLRKVSLVEEHLVSYFFLKVRSDACIVDNGEDAVDCELNALLAVLDGSGEGVGGLLGVGCGDGYGCKACGCALSNSNSLDAGRPLYSVGESTDLDLCGNVKGLRGVELSVVLENLSLEECLSSLEICLVSRLGGLFSGLVILCCLVGGLTGLFGLSGVTCHEHGKHHDSNEKKCDDSFHDCLLIKSF